MNDKQAVRDFWEGVGTRDWEEAFSHVLPEAEFHYVGNMFGPDGFRRTAAQHRSDGENHVGDVGQPATEVLLVVGEGDVVIAEVRFSYREGVHGSFPLDWDADNIAIHTMVDGKIANVRLYVDTEFQSRLMKLEQERQQPPST